MKKSNRVTYRGDSWKNIEKILRDGHSRDRVFRDWIDLMLAAHLSITDNLKRKGDKIELGQLDGIYEERYLEIISRYKSDRPMGERPADYFANAYHCLLKEIEESDGDPLGDIYMMEITYGEHGQFFTPFHIGDMMAKSINPKDGESVLDPCCGSGTLLLSAAKQNRKAIFTGIDLDERCAIMCTLNLFFRGLSGRVLCGNALTGEMYTEWRFADGLIQENDKPTKWIPDGERIKDAKNSSSLFQ